MEIIFSSVTTKNMKSFVKKETTDNSDKLSTKNMKT